MFSRLLVAFFALSLALMATGLPEYQKVLSSLPTGLAPIQPLHLVYEQGKQMALREYSYDFDQMVQRIVDVAQVQASRGLPRMHVEMKNVDEQCGYSTDTCITTGNASVPLIELILNDEYWLARLFNAISERTGVKVIQEFRFTLSANGHKYGRGLRLAVNMSSPR